MPKKALYLTASIAFLFTSCTRCTLHLPSFSRSISIMSYNVENLFDDRDDGTEYREYDPGSGTWDTAMYHAKLANVAEAIRSGGGAGPDICLLQEVENERVVTDLREGYLNVLKYSYSVTAPGGITATTVAMLSRWRPVTALVHRIHVNDDLPLRTILEVEFEIGGRNLIVFNNHWKSKSGGARETEGYRLAAAAFIVERVEELVEENPDVCVVVAGDLNERPMEHTAVDRLYPTALRLDTAVDAPGGDPGGGPCSIYLTDSWAVSGYSNGRMRFFSPWLTTGFQGSYVFRGIWQRIDHFLLVGPADGGLRYSGFEVVMADFLLTEAGYPKRWNGGSASGYSDHLPIILTLER